MPTISRWRRFGLTAKLIALSTSLAAAIALVLAQPLMQPASVLLAQTDTGSATSILTAEILTADTSSDELRSTVLQGQLPTSETRHFLGVEPLQRDGVIVLTLSYDPYSDPQLQGLINFQVLDEDGLRVYMAGGDLDGEEIATGSLVQFDPIGNKMRAAFQDSGRGNYTAVITNDSSTPVTYTLSALGATLIDDAGQTEVPASLAADAASADSMGGVSSPTPSEPLQEDEDSLLNSVGFVPIRARRVTGELGEWITKHYLEVDSNERDGLVRLKMTYQPDNVRELLGKTNFLVLDEDGLRRYVAGDDPRTLNIATGFPSPVGEDDTTLLAAFKSSGEKDYTVVVFNDSDVTSTYALEANGALLEDDYGQTNESKVAALEQAALRGELPVPTPTPAPTARPITPLYGPTLTGELTNPFEHHYYGLLPTFVDGTMIVTMDFDPRDTQELAENINFMILDDDGWRRVLAGARPEDVELATGYVVEYGDDAGKLRATLNASGKGEYTVIVYNNSYVPGLYSLTAKGALLEDASEQAIELGLP